MNRNLNCHFSFSFTAKTKMSLSAISFESHNSIKKKWTLKRRFGFTYFVRWNFLFSNLFESHSSMEVKRTLSCHFAFTFLTKNRAVHFRGSLWQSQFNENDSFVTLSLLSHQKPNCARRPFILRVWISWRGRHFTSIKRTFRSVCPKNWGASRIAYLFIYWVYKLYLTSLLTIFSENQKRKRLEC